MSLNTAFEPVSPADIPKWESDHQIDFGEHGKTLADPKREGFKALFNKTTRSDGAIVLKRGSIISKTPSVKDPKKAIEEALNSK